ncbi:MAG: phage integrase SAM-like domain-containing protein [Parabacteroides sp.]|nr:phage integrase SAM-like domain-containing protein [Parabacteroides sp.]
MYEQEQQKRECGDDGTANLYRAARNHFTNFAGSKTITLKGVTPEVVQTFLLWLQGKGLQVNSVNSYMSNLRAMYNRACLGWRGRPVESPFAGLRLKREETRKRAVPVEVIGKIASLDLKEDPKK